MLAEYYNWNVILCLATKVQKIHTAVMFIPGRIRWGTHIVLKSFERTDCKTVTHRHNSQMIITTSSKLLVTCLQPFWISHSIAMVFAHLCQWLIQLSNNLHNYQLNIFSWSKLIMLLLSCNSCNSYILYNRNSYSCDHCGMQEDENISGVMWMKIYGQTDRRDTTSSEVQVLVYRSTMLLC